VNFYDGTESLLALGVNYVGKGNAQSFERRAQLRPGTNTRAMEYVLNDMMISLFGRANPYYVEGTSALDDIAIDFNINVCMNIKG